MRISLILVVTFVLFVESVHCTQGKDSNPKLVTEWKQDPVCKAVYDGVLNGLYRDRVSDEIVTNIIGKKTQKKRPENIAQTHAAKLCAGLPTVRAHFCSFPRLSNSKKRPQLRVHSRRRLKTATGFERQTTEKDLKR